MTKKRLLRFSPYLTFLFCYGLVTIVGLIPGLLYGNEMGYWLLGFWLILPVSALLCTFRAAYRALPRYGQTAALPAPAGHSRFVGALDTVGHVRPAGLSAEPWLRAYPRNHRTYRGHSSAQSCQMVSAETQLIYGIRCGFGRTVLSLHTE